MRPTITALNDTDKKRLQDQINVVRNLIRGRYEGTLDGSVKDLAFLQLVLDDQLLKENQTYELQCLGIVLGDVLSRQAGLEWVSVEDENGRDPALKYPNTSILIFPLTMVSKRIEKKETVNVQAMFDFMISQVKSLSEKVDKADASKPPQVSFWRGILIIIVVVLFSGIILLIGDFVMETVLGLLNKF